ncbi:MAG: bifunctional histidinol-phosphatase/imidazoleglycerol-phosphate dehydratase HisB [Bacteroidales bacterium]
MMKPVLFIDRDGTILIEPAVTEQIDSLELLSFLPNSISSLKAICNSGIYSMVMVTNQDGLGTASFPEETFWKPQNKMLEILKSESIHFDDIYIDRSFPHQNLPTRKPGTAMLTKYITGAYDIKNSYVIGDRVTDVELAKNLGCKAIFIAEEDKLKVLEEKQLSHCCALITTEWTKITEFLLLQQRKVVVERNTNETKIKITLNLDGSGKSDISTGIHFFDHMLEQLARHSNCDISIKAQGDLHIDEHHTIEDIGITLGMAFKQALGDKKFTERYGFLLPMDDCLAQVAIDFSGRAWLVWDVELKREKVGDMPTEMVMHFFKSFSDNAACNLNIKADGENEHHKIEAIFKAVAKSIKQAVNRNLNNAILPSTKGVL